MAVTATTQFSHGRPLFIGVRRFFSLGFPRKGPRLSHFAKKRQDVSSNPRSAGWETYAKRLQAEIARHAKGPAYKALVSSLAHLTDGDFRAALDAASLASQADPSCGLAWRIAALAHEGLNQTSSAVDAYRSAHLLDPGDYGLLSDLGRLSLTLGLTEVAADFFARALALDPQSSHLAAQLATALRDGHDYGGAVAILRRAIVADANNAHLWNALGSVVLQQGDTENALIFFGQAAALDPSWTEPIFNRAVAKFELGDLTGAVADCDDVWPKAKRDQKSAVAFLRAQAKLAIGDLTGGWKDYRARLSPEFATSPIFLCPGRRLRASDDLKGKRLLVIGEQGIGDEIMFASMISDVIEALGAHGKLTFAVAPRLVKLFERSFPSASFTTYATRADGDHIQVIVSGLEHGIDLWAPLGALAQRFRRTLSGFERSAAYIHPAPGRVQHWREVLGALNGKPKIGLSWKSMNTSGMRLKRYPPFEAWRQVMQTPGLSFINLQYGDCADDIKLAKTWGGDIWSAPNTDLTNDLDEAAALSAAVDLVVGVGNASINLAAAIGVPTWLVTPFTAWPRLGTDRYPWFAHTRIFAAGGSNDWNDVFNRLSCALLQKSTSC